MKRKTAKMLPKTADEIGNGGIYLQKVKCGKKNCKCAHGEQHLAYYFFTRERGKLTKFYIRQSQLKDIAMIVFEARYWRKLRRNKIRKANEIAREASLELKALSNQIYQFDSELTFQITGGIINE
jgi:hypothetical protein